MVSFLEARKQLELGKKFNFPLLAVELNCLQFSWINSMNYGDVNIQLLIDLVYK